MTDILTSQQCDMLYLAACELNSQKPDVQRVSTMDLSSIYRIAKRHSMTAIIYMSLDSTNALDYNSTTIKLWREDKEKAIRKSLLLDAELSGLSLLLQKNKIWYMPLKGSILKHFYPKLGMREMSDCDILFDSQYRNTVCELMQGMGYRRDSHGRCHDVYFKPPVCNFEMHISLFGSTHRKRFADYYADVEQRLIRDKDNPFLMHFSDEDFYIYLIAHAGKHYENAGTGIRTLMDVFVYNRAKGSGLDREYIRSELSKLELDGLEADLFKLSDKLFGSPTNIFGKIFDENEEKQLSFILGSGTHGTAENAVESRFSKLDNASESNAGKMKRSYYLSRLFPDMQWYKAHYPYCYRHKWSIPLNFIYRVFHALFFKRKKLKNEIKAVDNVLAEKADKN